MKIVGEHFVIGNPTPRYRGALSEIQNAIRATRITLKPVPKGNGVKPIKDGVITLLIKRHWEDEHPMDLLGMKAKPLDAFKEFRDCRVGFEWETGNISSSFRALMKLIKGLIEDELDLGVHVVPSRAFYKYLTDRVGNISELEPYLDVFGKIKLRQDKALLLLVVEYDSLNKGARLIPKGKDGMSFKRRGIR